MSKIGEDGRRDDTTGSEPSSFRWSAALADTSVRMVRIWLPADGRMARCFRW